MIKYLIDIVIYVVSCFLFIGVPLNHWEIPIQWQIPAYVAFIVASVNGVNRRVAEIQKRSKKFTTLKRKKRVMRRKK